MKKSSYPSGTFKEGSQKRWKHRQEEKAARPQKQKMKQGSHKPKNTRRCQDLEEARKDSEAVLLWTP
jgi:hypothetical protein